MVVPTLRFGARREPQGGERFRLKAAWKRDDQAYRGQYAMSHVIHTQATVRGGDQGATARAHRAGDHGPDQGAAGRHRTRLVRLPGRGGGQI